jgi:phosphohistidine phosphatase
MTQAVRTLILLRHAKSDWSGREADIDRPLAARGRRQAPEAGAWLAGAGLDIDVAVVSPAQRARSTWELASAELAAPPELRVDERVYAASAGELLDVLTGLPPACATVVLVGHNPGLEDLATALTGRWVPLPTSALAVIGVPVPWSAIDSADGTLLTAGRPPEDRGPGPVSGTP